jgi:hypothetical protein
MSCRLFLERSDVSIQSTKVVIDFYIKIRENIAHIYKVHIFSVKHIQFTVKITLKATCFGSTEPSSGIFVRTDLYPITSTFGIPSVYNDGTCNAYTVGRYIYKYIYIYIHIHIYIYIYNHVVGALI